MTSSAEVTASRSSPAALGETDADFRRLFVRLYFWLGVAVLVALAFPFPQTKWLLGAVLAGVFVYLLTREISLALCMVAFSVPIMDLTPSALNILPGINIQTITLMLLVLGYVHGKRQERVQSHVPPLPVFFPLVAFLLACLAGIIQSHLNGTMPLLRNISLFKDHFAYTILMVIAYQVLRRREQRAAVLYTVVAISALLAVHSVLDYGSGARERSTGLIGQQPNLYGAFLVMQIPYCIGMMVTDKIKRSLRVLAAIAFVFLMQGMVFTGSRGAWLGAFFAILLIGTLANRKALLILVVLALAVPLLFFGFNKARYDQTIKQISGSAELDDSAEFRTIVWGRFFDLVEAPWIWGRGYQSAKDVILEKGISDHRKSTHSSLITLGIEMGFIGIGLYIWLLAAMFAGGLRCVRGTSSLSQVLGIGLIGAVPALFLCDITGERFFNGEIMAYFWLLGGLALRESVDPSRDGE